MIVDVKICGITRPEDAALAVVHGAWRLGVIFAWGPRVIDTARAKEIVDAAGRVPVIGVFGMQSVEEIAEMSSGAGLSGAQLHRPTTPQEAAVLQQHNLEVWRVAQIADQDPLPQWLPSYAQFADTVLLEPGRGRTGKGSFPLDLSLAREARDLLPTTIVALAGGLTAENVIEAIRFVSPRVVDVSSGVESRPGIKDPDRLKRFLESARDASPTA